MKALFTISLLMLTVLSITKAQDMRTLQVIIADLNSDNGKVKLELRNEYDCVIHQVNLPISGKKSVLTLKNLPKGTYFINYFHDADNNDAFGTNFLGIPNEGYGFSNNPNARFGPPANDKLFFKVQTDTTVVLKTFYW